MKSTDTAKKILHQAILLFATKGFTDTSLADICSGALVSRPSIFYYFESKDGLYQAAYRKACHDVANSDIWSIRGHPDTVFRKTLNKLTGHYFGKSELSGSLHFMLMEYVHPRMKTEERDLKDLSLIRSRIIGLFKAFCPDLSDADIKLLLCAILGELITSRSSLDMDSGAVGNPAVQDIVDNLLRIASSVRRGIVKERPC